MSFSTVLRFSLIPSGKKVQIILKKKVLFHKILNRYSPSDFTDRQTFSSGKKKWITSKIGFDSRDKHCNYLASKHQDKLKNW